GSAIGACLTTAYDTLRRHSGRHSVHLAMAEGIVSLASGEHLPPNVNGNAGKAGRLHFERMPPAGAIPPVAQKARRERKMQEARAKRTVSRIRIPCRVRSA